MTQINRIGISGYPGIHPMGKNRWRFRLNIDGKQKTIKTSIDLEKLIQFADKWKIDNNYHT